MSNFAHPDLHDHIDLNFMYRLGRSVRFPSFHDTEDLILHPTAIWSRDALVTWFSGALRGGFEPAYTQLVHLIRAGDQWGNAPLIITDENLCLWAHYMRFLVEHRLPLTGKHILHYKDNMELFRSGRDICSDLIQGVPVNLELRSLWILFMRGSVQQDDPRRPTHTAAPQTLHLRLGGYGPWPSFAFAAYINDQAALSNDCFAVEIIRFEFPQLNGSTAEAWLAYICENVGNWDAGIMNRFRRGETV